MLKREVREEGEALYSAEKTRELKTRKLNGDRVQEEGNLVDRKLKGWVTKGMVEERSSRG